MSEEVARVLPEVAVRAVKPEQFRQLRAGEKERHPAFEADHDTLGDEVHYGAGSHRPRDERNDRNEHGGGRRKLAEAGHITPGDLA